MNETLQIIIGIIVLIVVFMGTRLLMGLKIKKACQRIINDLEVNEALGPMKAVELPYAESKAFNIGLRNYHPKALSYLIQAGVVLRSSQGRYYLKSGWREQIREN
jgi:hypothetical protein